MCVNRTASVEAPPAPEELRRAWEAARGRGHLAAKLLVGTLLSNLEPAVDQSYLRAEDVPVGEDERAVGGGMHSRDIWGGGVADDNGGAGGCGSRAAGTLLDAKGGAAPKDGVDRIAHPLQERVATFASHPSPQELLWLRFFMRS